MTGKIHRVLFKMTIKILPIIFLITIILGFIGFGYMHERVHVEIYRSYGIESHIEYFSHFPDFVTVAEEGCPTESCELAHNINEAIGYPLMAFYLLISIGMLILIVIKED